MVTQIQIQNYKSLQNLQLQLGRVNILVGANSAGKTNILEGIALGAAAAAGTLDNETLKTKIRLVAPDYMRSAFENNRRKDIFIQLDGQSSLHTHQFELHHDGKEDSRWRNRSLPSASIAYEYSQKVQLRRRKRAFIPDLILLPSHQENIGDWRRAEEPQVVYRNKPDPGPDQLERLAHFGTLADYQIYAPEASNLKAADNFDQIDPLGTRGEGLFGELLRIYHSQECLAQQEEIRAHLALFDWFVDIKVQKGSRRNLPTVVFQDRFMKGKIGYLDRESVDDGFLHLLFYLVLFTSPDTPKFFAIENLESRFNPRMCWELMSLLTRLAKQYDKQVIVTTHNAHTLNGLDLKDDDQRLFVASRNSQGHTRVQRISQKPSSGTLLSEIWTKGYIGGMPDNF